MDISVDEVLSVVVSFVTTHGLRLLLGLVVLWIGFALTKLAVKVVSRQLKRREVDATLHPFIRTIVGVVLRIIVAIGALNVMGLMMTSFVAILGAASLAIGMALSGTMQNFAGGLVILILRPFKSGDFIEAQGYLGTVDEIQLFHTTLKTPDNKTVIIPNGPLSTNTLVNFTREKVRRVDFTFGIGYGDEVKVARDTLMSIFEADSRILKDPPPFVGLGQLADSSVNLTIRVWTDTAEYWDVFFSVNEEVYNQFNAKGIKIPFPQMDLHVHKEQ